MKTVLIISYSPLHRDPRILRQIKALKQDYKILTIGYTQVNDDSIIHYSVNKYIGKRSTLIQKIKLLLSILIKYNDYERDYLQKSLDLENILPQDIIIPDVIIANDWNGLYLASELKLKHNWQTKIYFDAHEYSPKEYDISIKWRFALQPIIINTLKKCKKDINIMSTVCDGIAREYEKFFDFPMGFVIIITNAAEYISNLKPKEIRGRDIIRFIHHGGAIKERKLELMIKMMKYLDPEKYELTFMLVKNDIDYYNQLFQNSQEYKNIKFIEPVYFSEITNTLNNYDIGIYILKPESYNDKYALPNKLFEFIQARLAIAIGPSIEMVKIIDHYNLGVYSKNFKPKSLAKTISQLTYEKIMEFKINTDKFAKELSDEDNINKIKEIIDELAEE